MTTPTDPTTLAAWLRSHPPSLKRFWSMVNQDGPHGCWEWRGTQGGQGYGSFRMGSLADGTRCNVKAHRLSFALCKGEVPDKSCVLHNCDNRRCVNPAHLYLGTQQDNLNDAVRRMRLNPARGEQSGVSKLTDADVLDIRNSSLSNRALSRKHGICKSAISRIRSGKSWKHVGGPLRNPPRRRLPGVAG